jgi:hypothetical protein
MSGAAAAGDAVDAGERLIYEVKLKLFTLAVLSENWEQTICYGDGGFSGCSTA